MTQIEKKQIEEAIADFKYLLESEDLPEKTEENLKNRIDCLQWVLSIARLR